MEQKGLAAVRRLMDTGFNYDNLEAMAELCHGEKSSAHALTAFVLHRIFLDIAKEIGDGPVLVSELRKREARYRTMINLVLEGALAGAAAEQQVERLSKLVRLHWGEEKN